MVQECPPERQPDSFDEVVAATLARLEGMSAVKPQIKSKPAPKAKRPSRAKKAHSPLADSSSSDHASSDRAEQAVLSAVVAREVRGDTDLPRDIIWAYENLGNRRVKESDAPGNGAWGLLKHAREYRKAFYEQLLPKALAVKEKVDKERRESEGRVLRDKGLPELVRLMRETLGR